MGTVSNAVNLSSGGLRPDGSWLSVGVAPFPKLLFYDSNRDAPIYSDLLPTPVPEPATSLLSLGGLATFLLRRHFFV